jgi:cytochrome c-type biogenesis protein
MTQNMNLAIAFVGGVLAFFSPCFLPLVPAYLIYITGLSFEEVKDVRAKTVFHSIIFILGFTIVFTFLGMAATLAGRFLHDFSEMLMSLGGLLLVILGFYLVGLVKLPFLDLDRKLTISSKPSGYIGTFFVGMVFALGWSPCVGPLLAAILLYAGQSATLGRGMMLLTAFSFGLGLPLFLFSLAVNYSLSLLKSLEKHIWLIHWVCGIFLVIIGFLLMTNQFQDIFRLF